jgi:hypothetical protein
MCQALTRICLEDLQKGVGGKVKPRSVSYHVAGLMLWKECSRRSFIDAQRLRPTISCYQLAVVHASPPHVIQRNKRIRHLPEEPSKQFLILSSDCRTMSLHAIQASSWICVTSFNSFVRSSRSLMVQAQYWAVRDYLSPVRL